MLVVCNGQNGGDIVFYAYPISSLQSNTVANVPLSKPQGHHDPPPDAHQIETIDIFGGAMCQLLFNVEPFSATHRKFDLDGGPYGLLDQEGACDCATRLRRMRMRGKGRSSIPTWPRGSASGWGGAPGPHYRGHHRHVRTIINYYYYYDKDDDDNNDSLTLRTFPA